MIQQENDDKVENEKLIKFMERRMNKVENYDKEKETAQNSDNKEEETEKNYIRKRKFGRKLSMMKDTQMEIDTK